MFIKKIFTDKNLYILLPILLIFVFFNIWLAWPNNQAFDLQPRFDWPDETANYFWVSHFTQTGQLFFDEPLNGVALNQIHPRSFNVNGSKQLVPGSFLGLILFYALFAKVFGIKIIFILGPFLAALSAIPFYFLIKKFFDQKIALVSSVLMLCHPAWWYYSASPLLPNAVFIFALLVSLATLISWPKANFFSAIISGIFFGLAFVIRPSEAVWIFGLIIISFLFQRKKYNWQKILIFLVAAGVILLPSLFFQYSLYGSFLGTGYDQLQNVTQNSCQICKIVQSLVLPFGFHPIVLLKNFWHHYFLIFWPINLLVLAGLLYLIIAPDKKKYFFSVYFLVAIALHFWLIIYYGNWQFADQMTVNLNVLAVSYVRYWLLLYLLTIPFAASALLFLAQKIKLCSRLFLIFLIALIFCYSGLIVLFSENDSLLNVKSRIFSYYQSASEINDLTEDNSIVIVNRKDKVLFPERKVIHTFEDLKNDDLILSFLPSLVSEAPVYYLALSPVDDHSLRNGLRLELVKKINNEYLYKVR